MTDQKERAGEAIEDGGPALSIPAPERPGGTGGVNGGAEDHHAPKAVVSQARAVLVIVGGGAGGIVENFNPPGLRNYWKVTYLNDLPEQAVDVMVDR